MLLREDLHEHIENDWLIIYKSTDALPHVFYFSLLGKKRQIHHLSHPAGKSINDEIPAELGEITYHTVDEVIAIIPDLGAGAVMLKRDFQEAFRQIPV